MKIINKMLAFLPIFSYLCRVINNLVIHLKKHTIMNKTWKIILQILSAVIHFLLSKDGKGEKNYEVKQ